ncbi:MAG: hypothetical protein JJ850_12370 [Kordiimonadaceae bacterium]|nr:hypothetical protein [Kordiimonadaceae bacterium]MBO6568614.1 hypothetical protein [Kordiimonadaceae bacterium]MBO6965410.1 hypothetical protein [Kordiimonadaceae bacterium]
MLAKFRQANVQSNRTVSAIRSFLAWWFSELKGVVREGFSKTGADPNLLMLDLAEKKIWFSGDDEKRDIGSWSSISTAKNLATTLIHLLRGRQPAKLAICHDNFMEAQVTVPVVARNNLEAFLTFELDRYFPIAPEELVTCFEYIGESEDKSEIEVSLIACRRSELTFAQELASNMKCELKYLCRSLEKLHYGNLVGEQKNQGRASFGALKTVATLLLIAFSVGIFQQKTASEKLRLADQFDRQQSSVVRLQAAVQEIQNRLGWIDALHRDYPVFLTNLDGIIGSLGPEGEVQYIVWDQKTVEWRGRTKDTAAMIARLVEASSLSSIEYLSPVQSLDAGPLESFHLQAAMNLVAEEPQ